MDYRALKVMLQSILRYIWLLSRTAQTNEIINRFFFHSDPRPIMVEKH